MLQTSMHHACTSKDERNMAADKQRKKQRRQREHAKNILTMGANKAYEAYERANKYVIKQNGVS